MSIFLHAILRWASVVCLVVYGAGDALAATITLETNFPGRGWFNDIGFHVATNDNTFTGTVNPNPEAGSGRGLNSFFIWDLAPLMGNMVTSATFRVGQDNYFSQDPRETIEIYDVSATRDQLVAGYPRNSAAGIAIHNDLQTGSQYGSFQATPNSQFYSVVLSNQALTDINAAMGGFFALAMHNATDSMVRQDGVRFDRNPRVHQLILETAEVPEPVTTSLVTLASLMLAGWVAHQRRRRE